MRVVSLFDGMSCGQIALQKLGVKIDRCDSYEIDKFAIQVTKENFPDTIHHGSVEGANFKQFEGADLLLAGSPCQGFSFAGKMLQFNDPRSRLFFDFVRALDQIKPKYFLLENVKMKRESEAVITKYLGVEPIRINSALVSAQNRNRLYWTNIPGITQPQDREIYLKDILEENPENAVYLSDSTVERFLGYGVPFVDKNTKKARCLSAMEYIKNGKQGNYVKCFNYSSSGRGENGIEGRVTEADKALTLTRGGYSTRSFTGVIQVNPSTEAGGKQPHNQNRVYDPEGKARSLTAAFASRTNVVEPSVVQLLRGRGNNPGGIRALDGKSIPMTSSSWQENVAIASTEEPPKFRVRKLTVTECKRLQTVPDDYKMNVSNSQAYKMLGNGWTVDVIAHILGGIQ